MSDVFDRLMKENYSKGMRRFAPPIAPPFAPPGPKTPTPVAGVETPPVGPQTPITPTEKKEPSKGLKLTLGDVLELLPEEEEKVKGPTIEERTMARLSREEAERPVQADPSFWEKILNPLMGAFSWVEKIDATSFGLIWGGLMSVLHGKTLWQELGVKPGESLWAGAEEYIRKFGTAQQIIGEIILSPFNLLPVV